MTPTRQPPDEAREELMPAYAAVTAADQHVDLLTDADTPLNDLLTARMRCLRSVEAYNVAAEALGAPVFRTSTLPYQLDYSTRTTDCREHP